MKVNIYKVNFEPIDPVPNGLIIRANTQAEAYYIACETIKHTEISLGDVEEIILDGGPQVLFYESGVY